jgi:hypothetical protein
MIKAATISFCLMILMMTLATRTSAQVALEVKTPQKLTDVQVASLIEQVKQMPVSRLDSALPGVSFAKWLQDEAGPGARIRWVLRYAKATDTDGGRDFPTCIEADAMMGTGRSIVILVGIGTPGKVGDRKPFVYRVNVMDRHDAIDFDHLRDLPAGLTKVQPTASHSEVVR